MAIERFRNLEEEKDDLVDDINNPFDPKDIDITVETRSLDSLISRIKHKEIDLNTHFQRKGDLWANTIMSRLIESILIRFPLPAFYFDATDDEKWLIVDGLQRISAIKKFVLNCDEEFVNNYYTIEDKNNGFHRPLKLVGLEYLKDYNGLTFADLSPTMKRRINEAQITTYLVKPGTPEDVVYSVFYRINTGGLMLNAQEIRHALNQNGKSPDYVEQMASLEIFKKIVKVSDKRMQDRELALRYSAFMLNDYKEYKPSMVRFLNKVMKELNNISDDDFFFLKSSFEKALETCYELFGEDAFSKSILNSDFKNSLNRALFEVWTVTISTLHDEDIDSLLENKEHLLSDFKDIMMNAEFDKAISISTTGFPQVIYRFKLIELLVKKYI